MDVFQALERNCFSVSLEPQKKDGVLRQLAELAANHPAANQLGAEVIYEKMMARESQGTTGFGSGIAIPHARLQGLSDFVTFVVTSEKGVDFDAMDKKKVHVIGVILGPAEKVEAHLKILAAFSKVFSNSGAKKELLTAANPNILFEVFVRHLRIGGEISPDYRKMKMLYVVLYNEELLYEILEYFIEEGIEGATITDGVGMGQYISSIPLFAGFLNFLREDKNRCKVLMALIPERHLQKITAGLEEITGDLDKKQGAMIWAMDICFYKGTMKMM